MYTFEIKFVLFYYTTFNVIICMETFWATLSANRFFLIHTKNASIRSSCIYEDVNYPLEMIYIFWNYPKLCWVHDRYGEYDITLCGLMSKLQTI